MSIDAADSQSGSLWARISSLSPADRELLQRQLSDGSGQDSGRIPRRRNRSEAELSYSQRRLWFLDRLEQARSTYNLVRIVRLTGALDVDALQRALNTLAQRHETLRTTFEERDGDSIQLIHEDRSIPLERPPFRGTTLEEALRLANEEAERPFDLSADRLLRATLLELGPREHVLFVVMHHIVTDGWSMDLLFKELSAAYDAHHAGRAPVLPELPIQYSDYAVWQRERCGSHSLEPQLAYWREKLAGKLPTLDFPADYPRPPVQMHRGAVEKHRLPDDVVRRLKDLSGRKRVTLFMTLLTAFKILLARCSGQTDIIVGAPIAGRNQAELEGLIGCFINSIVLRTDLRGSPSFSELLSRVGETAQQAYEHQDVPFEQLLEELSPKRDLSRTPLFQVYFNMTNQPGSLKASGLESEPLERSSMDSKFDFTLYVLEHEDGVLLNLVYDRSLFTARRMRTMLLQYEALLEQVADHPDRDIVELSLLTRTTVDVLPDPTRELGADWIGPVHEKLTEHAGRTPEHPAVRDASRAWSYEELEGRANQLARYLRDQSVAPGDIVAIYAHRSASAVWAVLGTLKAGAAFLLLDSSYPPGRLVSYFEQARPRGFLDLSGAGPIPEQLAAASAACGCRLSLPDGDARPAVLERYSRAPCEVRVEADSLAYVTFTSGSTGRPKGVLGRHGSLSHFLPWQARTFELGGEDRFSMLSGLSHDPLQRDIFTALWVGATLCVPEQETIATPGRLSRWMAEEDISFAHLTPAMSQLLTETEDDTLRIPSLRRAFFVGDRLTRHDVSRLWRVAPNVTCVNSYGSAETQRAVGFHVIERQLDDQTFQNRAVYPVGKGMPDVQLLILTSSGKLAGVGELGEIFVRSPHIAAGYLNDAETTRRAFVANPYTGRPDDKMYKTGDLGRYRPDGRVEFVGRTDHQVSIRGFRIELQEIEAVLHEHRGVRKGIVVPRSDAAGETRLAAYVVREPAARATTRLELRSHLKEMLPEQMVPSSFVLLDSIPLTPNGKVNHDALPEPLSEDFAHQDTFKDPETATEKTLARVWKELLAIERVGAGDNFFDLGGDSLLATQLISRVRNRFQVELPLRAVFNESTLEEMSEQIHALQGDDE